MFGDGPDGGREATFDGPLANLGAGDWHGYLVVQAKFRQRSGGAQPDGSWAVGELRSELAAYRAEDTARRRPEYYLYATNVVLTPPAVTGSKDKVYAELEAAVEEGLIRDFDVWDYDKLCRFLDSYSEIRRAYGAWVLPGDVLAEMVKILNIGIPDFDNTLSLYLQKELIADQYANLEQAGHAPEERIPIARVFVDLPIGGPNPPAMIDESIADGAPGLIHELLKVAHQKLDPYSLSVSGLERGQEHSLDRRTGRYVLVGGPGQGKTTLGQFVCQLFRVALLSGRPGFTVSHEACQAMEVAAASCEHSSFDLPTARRFPLRIILNEFATALETAESAGQSLSLLRFIVQGIERRIDREIPIDVFRGWLSSYPWLIVLDGLDEVPPSSNRDPVLRAITEFWVDVSQAESDVLVLATTRPQGYNEEFSPKFYEHLWLAHLSPQRALHYAKRLIQVRFPSDPDRQGKILTRLERASGVEASARLMRSPLQVTIMATLVDQMGQPPEERWSLFSEYYTVIYKRELERNIPAAEILRRHRPNIDSIHQRVALVLQTESELAENTEAHLSRDRLALLVEDRLREEGHEGDDLVVLRDAILEAAAERLVFVVGLETDKIGFEIRSLQEFMAAEGLMDGGDDIVGDRLRAIAHSSLWRNVFLFAAGQCFAERQHLRDTIHTICAELNDATDDRLCRALLGGSILAMDLMEDGPAREQPSSVECSCNKHCASLSNHGETPERGSRGSTTAVMRPSTARRSVSDSVSGRRAELLGTSSFTWRKEVSNGAKKHSSRNGLLHSTKRWTY